MKTFFKEFGAFIKRGNVLDMAVGVIIGGAFSAIVTALTSNVLMPVVNWFLLLITGGNGLQDIVTFLPNGKVVEDGVVILEKSIYIDWGAFITAIINFILIALVLFLIIKTINGVSNELDVNKKMKERILEKMKKGDRLTSYEQRWVDRMKKKHPEMVPTLDEPEPEPEPQPEPTETERLLAEILEQLKANK